MAMRSPLGRLVLRAELLVIAALVLYYELGTFLFRADPEAAHQTALRLWDLEQTLGFDVEPWFQDVFSKAPLLLNLLIFLYVGPHFFLTIGFIAWSYWYRFASYPHVRDAFAAFTFLAFGFQWLFPVSPPRLVPEAGLADSIDQALPVSGNTDWVQSMSNSYAALPSVHFGWALLVALFAVRLTRSRYRWLWFAYPLGIALSILATGNHWTLDLVLSLAFLGLTEQGLALLYRRHWSPEPVVPHAPATARPVAAKSP